MLTAVEDRDRSIIVAMIVNLEYEIMAYSFYKLSMTYQHI